MPAHSKITAVPVPTSKRGGLRLPGAWPCKFANFIESASAKGCVQFFVIVPGVAEEPLKIPCGNPEPRIRNGKFKDCLNLERRILLWLLLPLAAQKESTQISDQR